MYFADDQAMITQIIVPRHYTRVAVIQDNTPGGLSNLPYMQGLASKYGYQVVASQIVNPGATNDTPQVLNLLKGLTRDLGLSMAFISHDLSVIRAICDRVYVLRNGRIVEEGGCEEVGDGFVHRGYGT